MNKHYGFSLIELMVVVAIVGIIAAVAYPSFQGAMKGTARSTAQADLMALGAAMERHKAATFTYQGAAAAGANTGKPEVFATHSPSQEPYADRKYDLTIESVSATGTSYRLEATPVTGSLQAGDGRLYLYSDGRKAWDKDNSGALSAGEFCWSC